MRVADLAALLGCELQGDGTVEVNRCAPIESAGPGDLTFVANPRYLRFLHGCRASAVIVAPDAPAVAAPTLRTPEPYLAFARAVEHFHVPLAWPAGVHPTAQVAASATLAADAAIGAYSVIGERVTVAAGTRIAPHVVVYDDVSIGARCTLHAHVTVRERVRLGAEVVLQGGDVVLEDEVEVGANSTIDRAMVGSTILRRGVKLDNLVMVAHGCEIGSYSMLAAQTGLSGSTRVGQWVRMGGQVGTAGHLTIGDGAQIAAQSGVPNSVEPGAIVGGYPAMDMGLWRRVVAATLRLPELFKRVRRLERRLGVDPPGQP